MKIQAIQNYGLYQPRIVNYKKDVKDITNPIEPETTSVPSYYLASRINFGASPSELVNRIKKAPIADKLAVGLSLLPLGGVMVMAKDLTSFQEALSDYVRCTLPPAISYVSFLKDERLKESYMFIQTTSDVTKVDLYNPNEKDIESWKKVPYGEILELEFENGGINVDNQWVPLQKEPTEFKNLDSYMDYFITERDLSGELFEWTNDHNNRIIEEIPEYFEENKEEISSETMSAGIDEIDNISGNVETQVKNTEEVKQKKKISFADVGGLDDVVKSLKRNLLYPMKYPEVFKDLMTCRGAVLYGPPGTGKTFLAEAFVAEAGASATKPSLRKLL